MSWDYMQGDSLYTGGCGCCSDCKNISECDIVELTQFKESLEDQIQELKEIIAKKRKE